MKQELAGWFKIEAVKPDGTVRTVADWFPNLILDSGLNRIGTGGIVTHAMVGGSSTAPSVSHTGLITPIASTSTLLSQDTGTELASNYCYGRRTFRFAQGVAVGNLSEVGVGWASNTCFSRALVVDSGGTPTTITVAADEILDVTYELRLYWPTTDFTATLSAGGVSRSVVARASSVGDWHFRMLELFSGGASVAPYNSNFYIGGTPSNLGAITVAPGMTFVDSAISTISAYVNNSYERGYTITLGPSWNSGTARNISAVDFRSNFLGFYKASFDPPLEKDNTKTLVIPYKNSWARRSI